ncbi:hypothetical protein H7R52_13960 [Weissella confusa]|uniref:ABC transporter substrate-binding protein n=1 Tax=Weissella confusa TaxID=1583 RepID=A0A923SNR4_WEICO|nr:hypothetical protein [Weissella confusa]
MGLENHNVDAVFVPTDNTIAGAMTTLIKNTDAAKVPVFPTVDTMVKDGGVAAESINQKNIGVMTGKMVPLEAQLKMMTAFLPEMKTLGVIYTSSDDSATTEARKMIALAEEAGLKVKAYSIASSNDLNQTSLQMETMSTKFENEGAAVSVGIATPAAVALANTINDKPVVFSASTNPLSAKLVKSYNKPGGNVTGVSDQASAGVQESIAEHKAAKVPTVGVLQFMSHPALDAINKGIKEGLADSGYTVGKDVKIDFQNAQGDQSNLRKY